jgi:DNA primase
MMSGENNIVISSILKRILGDPKDEYENIVQFEFNCPSSYCRNDVDKFNLGYNSDLNIFHCWKCKYKGFVKKLADDYGNDDEKEKIRLIFPKASKNYTQNIQQNNNLKKVSSEDVICELPEGFKPFVEKSSSINYRKAIKYLQNRKVDFDTIKKYNIGYTEDGPRKFRIIIPSYNVDGKINYYEARSYVPSIKPTYLKPDYPDKQDIIFNLKNINFNLPIYLVEGVFDMFPIINAIPLLGKTISELLLNKLIENQSKVIICLDEDAKKDAYDLYFKLESMGLDVYYVEIQSDIAKYYELNDRESLINLIKKHKKLDFNHIFADKLRNRKKGYAKNLNSDFVKREFERLKNKINE